MHNLFWDGIVLEHGLVKKVFLPKREDCLEYLREVRWGGTVRCPYCGSSDIWVDGATCKGTKKYQCQSCYRYFNDLTGTVFDNHKFPLEEMFYIIKEMESKSTSMIAMELDRDYESVLRFVHEVQGVACRHLSEFTLEGVIELDETYPHAGNKGVKQRKPRKRGLRKRGRGTWKSDKPPVVTMVKRGKRTR